MATGGSQRRNVVPHRVTASGEAAIPRAMDAHGGEVNFFAAVVIGALVIIVVGFVGILLS